MTPRTGTTIALSVIINARQNTTMLCRPLFLITSFSYFSPKYVAIRTIAPSQKAKPMFSFPATMKRSDEDSVVNITMNMPVADAT